MYYLSPLRYPGGKGEFAPYISRLAAAQHPRVTEYAEPFAGGAGAALRLLVDEIVRVIHINDLNPGIASMWAAVVNESDRFAERIVAQDATISEWEKARLTYLTPTNQEPFELGYATFLLNRWNRSGILDARPIGGLKQTGAWKIDARFNRANLAERVRFLGQYKNRIRISQLDGRKFLTQLEGAAPNTLVYVDPPYLKQGEDLYFDALTYEDHQELAKQLRASSMRWFLTYDVDARITDALYPDLRCASFRIAHTAQKQHVGVEYAVFSDSLSVPDLELVRRAEGEWMTPSVGS